MDRLVSDRQASDQEKVASKTLFRRYKQILVKRATSRFDNPGTGRTSTANLLWMCDTALTRDMPLGKMSRWLGFVQGVMATKGLIDVDEERDFSRPLFHAVYGDAETLER